MRISVTFSYKANGGIDTERAYPYDGEEEQCHFSRSDIGATDKGNIYLNAFSKFFFRL